MAIPQELLDLISKGQAVLFLGAGATRAADGPTGRELAQLLAHEFLKNDIPTDDLEQFAEILCASVDREEA